MQEPVAIVGIGCRFPGADNPQAFWRLLCSGTDAIREVPADRWNVDALYDPDPLKPGKMVSRWGGFIDQVDQFDWRTFRALPREVKQMDPQHRLLLEVGWEALEDAGIPLTEVAGTQTSVIIGIGWNDYGRLQSRNWSEIDGYTATGSANCFAANRLSYIFDLKGPSISLDIGCTSSLGALYVACQSLWSGEANLALAGGVNVILAPESTIMVSKAGLLSPDGSTKTLDANANGFVRGEGAGIVILKRLADVCSSDRVYAVIQGISINHNGHNEWIIASSKEAQETLLRDTYRKAEIDPAEVDYAELHGTGFLRGDPIEAHALGAVLGTSPQRTHPCYIGSVKTNIGHLESAAGIAGVIKVALSLHNKLIPPTLHVQQVNPDISLDDLHLAIPLSTTPWPEKTGIPVASVTTLAFTGSNAHTVLSAYPKEREQKKSRSRQTNTVRLLPLSARTREALLAQVCAMRDYLLDEKGCENGSWLDICYTASMRRTHHEHRLAVLGDSPQAAATALEAFLHNPTEAVPESRPSNRQKMVFLFSQQRSRWSLAEDELLMSEAVFRDVVEQCDAMFHTLSGRSLFERLLNGSPPSLTEESVPDPLAHFTLQIALAALWRSWGIEPTAVVGEGLGEIAAAYVSGALKMEDALQFISHICNESGASTSQMLQIAISPIPLYSMAVGRMAQEDGSLPLHWKEGLLNPTISSPQLAQLPLDGCSAFIEIGFHTALSEKCAAYEKEHAWPGVHLSSLHLDKRHQSSMLASLCTLYSWGSSIKWSAFFTEGGQCVSLPTYAWQRERLWLDWLDEVDITSSPILQRQPSTRVEDEHIIQTSAKIPGELDKALSVIWQEVLGLEKVEIHESFFELGGHSLLAVQLLARIRAAFQLDISLSNLLQSPTPAACAVFLSQSQGAVQTQVSEISSTLSMIEPDPAGRYVAFPLTDVQQAYLVGRSTMFELGNVGNHAYIEVNALDLDEERFTQALRRLIERHDMLRAVLGSDGQQIVLETVPAFQVRISDLRGQDEFFVAKQLERLRRELDHQVLSVEEWPAFEICLSRLDDRYTRIHLSIESMFIDAWSMNILVHEFIRLYYEPATALPALELSFRDYVLAEQLLHTSEQQQRSRAYWLERLTSLPPAPELPLAQNPATLAHPRFVHRSAQVNVEDWKRIKARAAQIGVTPSGLLLTTFAEILATWSKHPHFSINLSTFNRLNLHPQVNELVGDFTSLIVLAIDNTAPDTFENRARRLQQQLWNDLDHSDYSGIQVLRELARLRDGTISAIMPIVFTSLLIQDTASSSTPPWGETLYCVSQTPQVWLDHQVVETGGALVFHWESVDALFPDGLIDAMFDAYTQLLQRLARPSTNWQKSLSQIVPPAQLEQRVLANSTTALLPDELLHTAFLKQAAQQPSRQAVITSARTLTYKELYNYSAQLALQLRQLEVRPNHLVGVVMEKGWEQVIAVLAILQAGAAYLPIDPTLPTERLLYLLEHGDVEIVLTQTAINQNVAWPEHIRRLCVDESGLNRASTLPMEAIPYLAPVQKPEDLAYVIYTSGSTGLPKGVMIDHRGAVNTISAINQRFGVKSEDRILALSALNFDLSVYDIFGLLAVGGAIVISAAQDTRDPAAWLEILVRERVTIWNSVPALLQMLVEYIDGRKEFLHGSRLRLAMLSGDWIPLFLPELVRSLLPDIELISLGGATEASIWSILYPISSVDPAWKSIPYGKPMLNQTFFVLNDTLEPCPVWVPGQLYIGGIGLAQGYWHDTEKTQKSFFVHPHTGERLYRTGDLGRYLPDGTIEFLGREDFQVKVQGYRIELGEIEAMLLRHPAVRDVVVSALGERHADKQLVAYILPKVMHTIKFNDLQNFLGTCLPAYMVPTAYVLLEAWPLSANGKVDRKALPMPETFTSAEEEAEQVSETTNEFITWVSEQVASVLKITSVEPGRSLLEYGATSLSIVRIINLLEKEFQFRPKLGEFFRLPTIKWLVTQYENHVLPEQLEVTLRKKEKDVSKHLVLLASNEREEGIV